MDGKDVRNLLEDEITSRMQELSVLEADSDEYKAIADELAKLIDRYNDMNKIEMAGVESYERIEAQKAEIEIKKKGHRKEVADCIAKNGLTLVSIVGGFVLTYWGAKTTFVFEETGTITSMVGRNFINGLFKKK